MSKKLGLLILSSLFCFCLSCAVNPITGEEQFMLISPAKDIEIGRTYAPQIEEQMGGRITNENLQEYINKVGQKIGRVSHRPGLEYHFLALKDKSINAFALPGGYVFITRGMLENLTTEAQLAAILAHETIHVVARHASAAMSREIGIGILLSVASSQRAPPDVLRAAGLTRQILGLKYSREDEREADMAGLNYMIKAGYNPYGMVETMQMLQNQKGVRQVEFFSSHPSPHNRIAYLTQHIQARYYSLAAFKIGKKDYQKAVLDQLKN